MAIISELGYRGRIAPSPTGFLHLGHASTFAKAHRQMREIGGKVIFRMEDLDQLRCSPEFVAASMEDLRWWGLDWDEGPDIGGPFAPYSQSERLRYYLQVWRELWKSGILYPSPHSRKDVAQAISAPNEGDETEPLFPKSLRRPTPPFQANSTPGETNWRLRVPDGEKITFHDSICGEQTFVAGVDFGDFLVWRKDGVPSYELAVVADDQAMRISDVLRGEDLLLSTARQILIYKALQWPIPRWHHVPLIRDRSGRRLAKRDKDLAIRTLKALNYSPGSIPDLGSL